MRKIHFSANRRHPAQDTVHLLTRTGNLLQTRPANASRHSEPLTGHTELDSGSVPPSCHRKHPPLRKRSMPPPTHPTPQPLTRAALQKATCPRLLARQPPPQAPAAPQKKHAPAYLPTAATANTRRPAKEACPRKLTQTRHRKHPLLRKSNMPPLACPNPQPPRQKKSRQQKPPGKVKRQPSKKNGRLKKLLVNSSRSLCTSINCSLCSLKLLSIALLAELADCALSSINSFLCSTIHKSL